MYAKKSLGQHFLKDMFILDRIVQSIPPHISDMIDRDELKLIEVGIGLGDLTKRLIDNYKQTQLLVYEIDSKLIQMARANFAVSISSGALHIEQRDVANTSNECGYLYDSEYFLVSNLPYYIATKIILQSLRDSKCLGFLVMTQKEVAQKFCAKVFDRQFCALSVIAQSYGEVEYLFDVAPECFSPKPKVDSALFCFNRVNDSVDCRLEILLRQSFSNPRKTLASNLALHGWHKDRIYNMLECLGLSRNVRSHEISTKEYCKIASFLN